MARQPDDLSLTPPGYNARVADPWQELLLAGLLALGVVLYPINVLQGTATFLAVTGIMTNTWIFIFLADYYICRKAMKLSEQRISNMKKRGLGTGIRAESSRWPLPCSSGP